MLLRPHTVHQLVARCAEATDPSGHFRLLPSPNGRQVMEYVDGTASGALLGGWTPTELLIAAQLQTEQLLN